MKSSTVGAGSKNAMKTISTSLKYWELIKYIHIVLQHLEMNGET